MTVSSRAQDEQRRIAALEQLQILDTETEADFDDIVALAAQICDVPASVISFVDSKRTWFKAKIGVDYRDIPRELSFTAHWLDADDVVVVEDCAKDELFANNTLVTVDGVRFIASAPLKAEDGYTIGHLSVLDRQPRVLSDRQLISLRMLSKQVVALLKLRMQVIKLKQAEEESRNSEEKMNNIFHNAIDAVVVIDEDGKIQQWNPKAESIFGWTAAEAVGKSFHETMIPERCRAAHTERMKRHSDGEADNLPNSTIETQALKKDGTEFEIAIGISPATTKGNQSFICFISDITERKQATEKLDQQKKFYENILNNLPTDIAVFDSNHKYLFVNPGAIKDEEFRKFIIGKDDFEYCEYRNRDKSLAELRRAMFLEVKHSDKEIRWEDTVKDPEGHPITSLRRIFPVHDDKGDLSMVIGFGLDITDRKQLEEKQAAMLKQLSAQNTQLVDFCNIVSHNLRAPLVNMSMLVDFINQSEDADEQKQFIAKLNPVVENLHTTFNELVESIQIKQDLEIKSEKVRLRDYVQRVLDSLEVEINKSGAIFEIDFDEAPVIYYPPKYLSSIVHNLISNTLKYQSPNRKPVVKLQTRRVDDSIILAVSDNGLGIDMVKHKDNMFKIGKIFHRHPDAKGFGLFMTKTQVEAMEGRIWVESKPDVGSTFYIEFKKQG